MRFSATVIAAGLAVFLAGPASALVRYDFTAFTSYVSEGESINGGGFSFETPDLLTTSTTIQLAGLSSCSLSTTAQPTGGTCTDVSFNLPFSAIVFGTNTALNPDTAYYFYFPAGSLSSFGTYASITLQGQTGQLVISDLSDTVPEPTTWAMMLVGIGVMGTAMRRRKADISFG